MKLHEKRDNYFQVRRTHPLGTGVLTKQGRDRVILELWAREVETITAKYKAGVLSAAQVVAALAKMEGETISVGEAYAEFMKRPMKDASRSAYELTWRLYLQETFESKKIVEVTEKEMWVWEGKQRQRITKRKKPPSTTTLAFAVGMLKGMILQQKRAGKVDVVPWGQYKLRPPNYKKRLEKETLQSIDEMRRLVAAAARRDQLSKTGQFGDLAARVIVLLYTGLRSGELGALSWNQISQRAGVPILRVEYQVKNNWHKRHPEWDRPRDPTKTNRIDELPLHPDVMAALYAQMVRLKRATPCSGCGATIGAACEMTCAGVGRGWYYPEGPIFPGPGGGWRRHYRTVDPRYMRALVKEAVPQADASRFDTHATRHTFASWALVMSGGDLRRAMVLTRHEDVDVFSKYMHRVGRNGGNPLPSLGVSWLEALDMAPAPLALEEWSGSAIGAGEETAIVEVIAENQAKMSIWKQERHQQRREAQNAIDKRYRAKNGLDFAAAYAAWALAGKPGVRPVQVTAMARLHYDRARHHHYRHGPEVPKMRVPRDVRSWESLVRAIKMLVTDHRPERKQKLRLMPTWIAELQKLNPDVTVPRHGQEIRFPREWDAGREGAKAKWRYLGAWATYLAKREADEAESGTQVPHVVKGELAKHVGAEDESDET